MIGGLGILLGGKVRTGDVQGPTFNSQYYKLIGEETMTETIPARLVSGKTTHIRTYGAGETA